MTGAVRRVVVATSDQAFLDDVGRALAGLNDLDTPELAVQQMANLTGSDQALPDEIADASVLVIDDTWPAGGGLESLSRETSLLAVSSSFSADQSEFPSIRLIRALSSPSIADVSPTRPLIIICSEAPTLAFTQVALANGVDWIWSNRSNFDKLGAVILRLEELKARACSSVQKPRVLVVENAQPSIKALKVWLGEDFELSVVNAEIRPANNFYVTAEEAMEHFSTNGPFHAAVVDLALSDQEETEASIEVGTEDAALQGFISENSDISAYFKGILFVRDLIRRDPDITIIVFSTYLKNVHTLDRIKAFLGDFSPNIAFFFKETDGYRQLRDLLASRFLKKGSSS